MQFTEPADRLTAAQHARRSAPGAAPACAAGSKREGGALARRSQERRHVGLHVVEIRWPAHLLADAPLLRQSRARRQRRRVSRSRA